MMTCTENALNSLEKNSSFSNETDFSDKSNRSYDS